MRSGQVELIAWQFFGFAIMLWSTPVAGNFGYVQCHSGTLDPVTLHGKRFFDSKTGEYFPIKGIAYYPRPNDGPLSISNSVDFFTEQYRDLWTADIDNLKSLGINTVRIYSVDPSKNHDGFMCALQQAGIYVVVGLLADCLNCGIGPNEAPSCYPESLKRRGQFIINVFSKYSNLLAFSAGNEATLYARDRQPQINAACQKKFLRDMRSYVSTCAKIQGSILPRKTPIGMANWDNMRESQTLYFNCRTDPEDELENAEWYGLNSYLHCNPNARTIDQLSGWKSLLKDFTSYNLSVPVMVSEFGCRERFPKMGEFEAQRTWLQIDALYSPSYTEQFAGGVVFEYSAEKRIVDQSDQGKPWPYFQFMKLQYGVGYYSPIDCDHIQKTCSYTKYPEFDLLRDKFGAVETSCVPNITSYVQIGRIPSCPEGFPGLSDFDWPVDNVPSLPCYRVPAAPPPPRPSLPPQPSSVPNPATSPRHSTQPSFATSPRHSTQPSFQPSHEPFTTSTTFHPSARPSQAPSKLPTVRPSLNPSEVPSFRPSYRPSRGPSSTGSSFHPSARPSEAPSKLPTVQLSLNPSRVPSLQPSHLPSQAPSKPTSIAQSVEPISQWIAKLPEVDVPPTASPTLDQSSEPTSSVLHKIDAPVASERSLQPTVFLEDVDIFPTSTGSQIPLTWPIFGLVMPFFL